MKFSDDTVHTRSHSALGCLVLAASARGLSGIWFDGQRHQVDPGAWPQQPRQTLLQQASAELAEYFAGQRTAFDVPLDLSSGTPFQQTVWRALLGIAYGQTCSYRDVACQIGKPTSVRAVAGAIGRNPLSIMVPCHRVLGSNGTLTGYAGGLGTKAALLQREGARFAADPRQGPL